MVDALKKPGAFPHPVEDLEHLQTHISHVLLAGEFAYKIKKPLDLGFLDFSSLERRRHCCEEEIRLNSRLAQSVYLDVVPITGTLERPVFGGTGEVLDYAVRMRRFPQEALLSRREVGPVLIDRIAERAAGFHGSIPATSPELSFGSPEAVFFPMQQNFDQIRPLISDPGELARLDPLEVWTRDSFDRLSSPLARRKAQGHIRECHGDMHLGNIALVDGEVAIFDGIEFNPDLRWIDTINEVAFLVMDLEQAGKDGLARRFLNRYLELSGDYEALALLDFYKVYRALVRAKVTAIRLAQPGLTEDERAFVLTEYGRYVSLAERYTRTPEPALVITHGVSGSGKTYVTQRVLEALPAVRLRSDIERKRLYGLGEAQRSGSAPGGGIYTEAATERTYRHLSALARQVLGAGLSALVDATFLRRSQRQMFRALARELGRPFVILDLQASREELLRRLSLRQQQEGEASEADTAIMERQLASRDPLDEEEQSEALAVASGEPLPLEQLSKRMRG
jgi:aminoglycoside phosphotransferase family enzyme/predicted kinase